MTYLDEHKDEIKLFILDIRVPGEKDGLEYAEYIRESGSNAVIAITSAYRAPDNDMLKRLKCEWFAKPWHIMEVLDKLLPMIR